MPRLGAPLAWLALACGALAGACTAFGGADGDGDGDGGAMLEGGVVPPGDDGSAPIPPGAEGGSGPGDATLLDGASADAPATLDAGDPPLVVPNGALVCAPNELFCADFEGPEERLDWYLPFVPPVEAFGGRAYLSTVSRGAGALGSLVRGNAGSQAQLESPDFGQDLRTTAAFWVLLRTVEGSSQPMMLADHRIEAGKVLHVEVRLAGRRASLFVDGAQVGNGGVDLELATWTPLVLRQRTTLANGDATTTVTLAGAANQVTGTTTTRGYAQAARPTQRFVVGLARGAAGTLAEVGVDDVRVTIP